MHVHVVKRIDEIHYDNNVIASSLSMFLFMSFVFKKELAPSGFVFCLLYFSSSDLLEKFAFRDLNNEGNLYIVIGRFGKNLYVHDVI